MEKGDASAITRSDLQAWLDQHFPGRGGTIRASRALGVHRTTLERKLRGELPITKRDEAQIEALTRHIPEPWR
jgi:hypothetical protein